MTKCNNSGRPRTYSPSEITRLTAERALTDRALAEARRTGQSFEKAFAKMLETPEGREIWKAALGEVGKESWRSEARRLFDRAVLVERIRHARTYAEAAARLNAERFPRYRGVGPWTIDAVHDVVVRSSQDEG